MHRGEARAIVTQRGRQAHQFVVDLVADAIRRGEQDDAEYYEKVLQEVWRIRLDEPHLFRR